MVVKPFTFNIFDSAETCSLQKKKKRFKKTVYRLWYKSKDNRPSLNRLKSRYQSEASFTTFHMETDGFN